jgi:hypothetical protein
MTQKEADRLLILAAKCADTLASPRQVMDIGRGEMRAILAALKYYAQTGRQKAPR